MKKLLLTLLGLIAFAPSAIAKECGCCSKNDNKENKNECLKRCDKLEPKKCDEKKKEEPKKKEAKKTVKKEENGKCLERCDKLEPKKCDEKKKDEPKKNCCTKKSCCEK